jgi:hypothetical protein
MKMFEFPIEQACPGCQGTFKSAPLKEEYQPVIVIACPHCSEMLWRPGLDANSILFKFDPNADVGGI